MRSERYELGQLIIGTADFLCYSLKVDPTGRSQVDAFVWNENRSGEPAGTRTRGHLIKRKLPLQKMQSLQMVGFSLWGVLWGLRAMILYCFYF